MSSQKTASKEGHNAEVWREADEAAAALHSRMEVVQANLPDFGAEFGTPYAELTPDDNNNTGLFRPTLVSTLDGYRRSVELLLSADVTRLENACRALNSALDDGDPVDDVVRLQKADHYLGLLCQFSAGRLYIAQQQFQPPASTWWLPNRFAFAPAPDSITIHQSQLLPLLSEPSFWSWLALLLPVLRIEPAPGFELASRSTLLVFEVAEEAMRLRAQAAEDELNCGDPPCLEPPTDDVVPFLLGTDPPDPEPWERFLSNPPPWLAATHVAVMAGWRGISGPVNSPEVRSLLERGLRIHTHIAAFRQPRFAPSLSPRVTEQTALAGNRLYLLNVLVAPWLLSTDDPPSVRAAFGGAVLANDLCARTLGGRLLLARAVATGAGMTVESQPSSITSVSILPDSTGAVDIERLLRGEVSVDIKIGVNGPSGSRDELRLSISNDSGQQIADITLPDTLLAGGGVYRFNGMVSPGVPVPQAGVYTFQVIAFSASTVLAQSNNHAVYAPLIAVSVASPTSVTSGGVAVHPIAHGGQSGPSMPVITVTGRVQQLPPATLIQWELQAEVIYDMGNRNDHTHVGSSGAMTNTTQGPLATMWHASEGAQVQLAPAWGDAYCGGDVVIHWQVTIEGARIEGRTRRGDHKIWGENPPKADIRAQIPTSNMQVVAHRESFFAQFRNSLAWAYAIGPFTVLRAPDNGFGIGQLTYPPVAVDQLWNWMSNVDEMKARLNSFRADALAYQQQVQNGLSWTGATGGTPPNQGVAYATALAFTADQLDLEMWSRYNGGYRYHDYDPSTNTWVRRLPAGAGAGTSLVYADALLPIRQNVDAGVLPNGW